MSFVKTPDKLSYQISEKNGILVISLVGPLVKINFPVLNQCVEDLKKSQAKSVILNFQNVSTVELFAVPEIARMQRTIREKPALLRMCSLNNDHQSLLGGRGLLRSDEVQGNLLDAVKSLVAGRAA